MTKIEKRLYSIQWLKILFGWLLFLVFSVTLIHAQWELDVRLTNDPAISNTSCNNAWCIAASRDTVHVIWSDDRDGNTEIYYKRSSDGGVNWSVDTRLTENPAGSGSPSIAVSGSIVHVVWEDERSGSREIYYKRSTDGGVNWSADTRLTNASAGSVFPFVSTSPSIAVSGLMVHVVWEDQRSGNWNIYYKRSSNAGVNWSADTRLTNSSAGSVFPFVSTFPSIAVSGSVVHVVWSDHRDGNWEIYYKRSTDGGVNWSADTRLTNNFTGSETPSVAVSGSVVHVVWEDQRNGNWEIYYKCSTDGGVNWSADTRLTNFTAGSVFPSVAISGSIVHIVWWDARDGGFEIYYKRSTDAGVNWEIDTRLTNNPAGSMYPSIAVSGTMVHVVWCDERDGNREIYYKRNPTGNGIVNNEITKSTKIEHRLKIFPNPFVSFSVVWGHEKDKFIVYNSLGRRVGVYNGNRIGRDLQPGVYFLTSSDNRGNPLRLVKIK